MKYIIAVFNNRTQTMIFYNKLKAKRVACSIINNPRATNLTCGICVKFYVQNLSVARAVLSNLNGFIGFYNYYQIGNGIPTVSPLSR